MFIIFLSNINVILAERRRGRVGGSAKKKLKEHRSSTVVEYYNTITYICYCRFEIANRVQL